MKILYGIAGIAAKAQDDVDVEQLLSCYASCHVLDVPVAIDEMRSLKSLDAIDFGGE